MDGSYSFYLKSWPLNMDGSYSFYPGNKLELIHISFTIDLKYIIKKLRKVLLYNYH